MLTAGSKLTPEQRADVLRSYVHRHLDTTNKTDDEWIDKHAFYLTRAGRLDRRFKHCEPAFLDPRQCIAPGCSGFVPHDQGSDYCAACIRADRA